MILASVVLLAADLSTTPTHPQVAGGQEVVECAWIDTVAVTGGGGLCTGSLVHPRLVVYAAHCGDGDKQIRIGNTSMGGGGFTRATERCVTYPDYLGTNDQAHDWAFCVLEEAITEIPTTPPAFGCELERIVAGADVVIAGFGNDTDTGGSGTKRWAETTIVSTLGSTANIGGDGTSTCSGDSGGSAFIAMEDGSWRAISMTSTGVGCGLTGVHALMHPAIPWIEETAQIDITPCHDLDGTWNPTAACGGFYAGDETQYGTFDDFCEGTPVTGSSESCGAAFDAEADADPPTVSITAPSDGEELPADTPVSIAIDASDAGWGVREVWVEIDGMEQAVRDEYPPYGFADVPFPNGGYTVQAFAIDWADNVGMSEIVAFGVGEPAPETPDDDSGSESADSGDTGGPIDPTDDSDGDESESDGGNVDTTGFVPQDDGGGGGCGCTQRTGGAWWSFALVVLATRRASRSACGRRARASREP
jgi:hypothetical protein